MAATQTERGQARADAAQVEESTWLSHRRRPAPANRAEAAAELTAVRADLPARAEREANQWHAERDRLAEELERMRTDMRRDRQDP